MEVLIWACFVLAAGVFLLVGGAELLVHESIVLSRYFGISPIIIGLTVVALGTSAPELFVTVMANINGKADLAIGNIIGSNIANIGLILGVAATINPFFIPSRILRVELPFLILSVILTGIASWFGILNRIIAVILLVSFGIYLYVLLGNHLLYNDLEQDDNFKRTSLTIWQIILKFFLIIFSFIALVYGSKLLIKGAVSIANFFNCPELIIGLSLTAVGTSLPELASTISAVRRKQAGLVIGNVLGSNFANTCGILGISGLIKPMVIHHHVLTTDFPVMAVMSLVLIPIFRDKFLSRKEGICLLFAYFSFISIIYLKS